MLSALDAAAVFDSLFGGEAEAVDGAVDDADEDMLGCEFFECAGETGGDASALDAADALAVALTGWFQR